MINLNHFDHKTPVWLVSQFNPLPIRVSRLKTVRIGVSCLLEARMRTSWADVGLLSDQRFI